MNKNLLIYIFVGFIFNISDCKAFDCTPSLDCVELGYINVENECADIDFYCPFDNTKVVCSEKKLLKSCDSFGDILYDNGLCAVDIKDIDPNRTPVGIVVDPEQRLAIALTDSKIIPGSNYSGQKPFWSINHCETTNDKCDTQNDAIKACSSDGKENTLAVLNTDCSNDAFYSVNLYEPQICNSSFCKRGNWFLPSFKELFNVFLSRTPLNLLLQELSPYGATQLEKEYWTSTESSLDRAWTVYYSTTSVQIKGSKAYKSSQYAVRPMVKY